VIAVWYWHDGAGGWGWLAMALAMLLVWATVAALLVAAARSWWPRPRTSARDVLDERFARGEIDADEYQARRRALQDGAPG
jgi:putative membrane protein